jgi:hypothetical protein
MHPERAYAQRSGRHVVHHLASIARSVALATPTSARR